MQLNDSQTVNDKKVTVFAKLPKISIPTPYKIYNPGFAYLIEKERGAKTFLGGRDKIANIFYIS